MMCVTDAIKLDIGQLTAIWEMSALDAIKEDTGLVNVILEPTEDEENKII